MRKLSHSRYLDYGARSTGYAAYQQAKQTPTDKQKRFFRQLCAICRENGLDPSTGYPVKTRSDHGIAIDKLIARLQEAGVDIKGNGKKADYVLTVGEDKSTGSAYAHESIRVRDEGEEPSQLYIQIPAVDEGEENLTDKNAR